MESNHIEGLFAAKVYNFTFDFLLLLSYTSIRYDYLNDRSVIKMVKRLAGGVLAALALVSLLVFSGSMTVSDEMVEAINSRAEMTVSVNG